MLGAMQLIAYLMPNNARILPLTCSMVSGAAVAFLLAWQTRQSKDFLTSTLSHLKALILFAISLKLHTTAFAFLKALLLFLLGFYHNSGFIRFGLNSAQIQLFYAALSCAPAWRQQRYKSLVARA